MKRPASRWLIAVAAALPLLCAYSCAVPLGPGYHIEKESVELSFVEQPEPRLHLHGRYRLENVGNAPLTSLDVTVPDKDSLSGENLSFTIDGKAANGGERDAEPVGKMRVFRIQFESSWRPREKKDLEVAFDVTSGGNSATVIAADAFALDGASWFPALQAPNRLFAKGEQRADLTDLSIVLPKDFLAVAPGQQTGRKTHGETVECQFRLRTNDEVPYLVAGRYKQQLARNKGTSVYFWTFQGLPDDAVKSAGEQISSATQFFDSNFVAHARGKSPVWVVELPAGQIPKSQDTRPVDTGSLPNTILLNQEYLSRDAGRGQVSPEEIRLLSATWLEWMATPEPTEPLLRMALETYAADAFYESQQGAPNRGKKIAGYVEQYDLSHARAEEKPIAQITLAPADSPDQVNMALNKAHLFLYALEDACGQAPFRRGIGDMISDLRGREYGYDDLRAALNTECGRTAGIDGLFRPWLYQTGIPTNFRERYAAASAPQENK